MKKEKERLLGRQVWCQDCRLKRPSLIRRADFLVPLREKPYDLYHDDSGIDRRVSGICNECLNSKGKFHRVSTEPVNINHKHYIYKAG